MPGFPVLHCPSEFAQTNVCRVGDVIQPSHSLSPPLPAPNLSQLQGLCQRVGSFPMSQLLASGGQTIGASAPASVVPMNIQGWIFHISFRIDWLDLLAVQGTLKSLLQHHSSKASILWCSAYFMVQLSHTYMTTGKTIALTIWTFGGKIMSLLFNWLSRKAGEGIGHPLQYSWASFVAQLVKNSLAMQETWEELQFGKISWRREGLPTPVFWPGEFHGLYSSWGRKDSEWVTFTYSRFVIAFLPRSKNFMAAVTIHGDKGLANIFLYTFYFCLYTWGWIILIASIIFLDIRICVKYWQVVKNAPANAWEARFTGSFLGL